MTEIVSSYHHNIEKNRRRKHKPVPHPIDVSVDGLKDAISKNNFTTAIKIINKIDKNLLDKNILIFVIESKNQKIVDKIINKIDTTKIPFDEDILKSALRTRNSNIVRNVVDYTTDRNLFVKYKNQIQKSILKQKDIINLAGQILSHKDNNSFDRELQDVVVDMYLSVVKDHFSKSNIPKNFPIKQFEDSINESKYFLNNPRAINFNSLNDDNKFLVLPVYSEGHCFSTVVRKLEDEKISLTFVNLGHRPFEKFGEDNQYKEFVYAKQDALKILKDYSLNVRLDYPEKVVSTERAYNNFARTSIEKYTLNVTSRDQKQGNCFLKNIEKGIRLALSLGLSKTEDKNFNPNNLRVSVEGEGKYKVKFLKPIHKAGDKTNDNTELSTVELRRDLINKLTEKFPEYKVGIIKEWDKYELRKNNTVDKIDVMEIDTPLLNVKPNKLMEIKVNNNNNNNCFSLGI